LGVGRGMGLALKAGLSADFADFADFWAVGRTRGGVGGADRLGMAWQGTAGRECTRMGANRGAGGPASAVVDLGIGHRAWKAGVHHRDTKSTENGIGKTAHASWKCFLTRRRKDAKNCMGWMVANSREDPLVVSPPPRRSVQTDMWITHAS